MPATVCIKPLMHIMNDQVTRAKRRRRNHSPELKRELVARSLKPGASVAAIAMEAGINANLLFTWRRAHLGAMAAQLRTPGTAPVLLPVMLEAPSKEEGTTGPVAMSRTTGTIEVDIGRARMRLHGPVDEASVRFVLQTLRAFA